MKCNHTAILTLVQNDTTFTQRWVDYHRQAFDDMYILDHDSQGEAADLLSDIGQTAATIIPVHNPHSYDAVWMINVARFFFSAILQSYDAVAFVAIDEFLVPRSGELKTFIQDFVKDGRAENWIIRAAGYEVVHHKDQEPPLNWNSIPWLAQRKAWYPCRTYSKPVLAKEPIFWTPGFTNASNVPDRVTEELLLVHLHRIDYDECLRKHREARAREWKPEMKGEGPYRQNRLEEPEALSRWMLCDSDSTREYAKLEGIPEHVRHAV